MFFLAKRTNRLLSKSTCFLTTIHDTPSISTSALSPVELSSPGIPTYAGEIATFTFCLTVLNATGSVGVNVISNTFVPADPTEVPFPNVHENVPGVPVPLLAGSVRSPSVCPSVAVNGPTGQLTTGFR